MSKEKLTELDNKAQLVLAWYAVCEASQLEPNLAIKIKNISTGIDEEPSYVLHIDYRYTLIMRKRESDNKPIIILRQELYETSQKYNYYTYELNDIECEEMKNFYEVTLNFLQNYIANKENTK